MTLWHSEEYDADVETIEVPIRMQITRPPTTRDELWDLVYAMWNIRIPRLQVCDNHCSPFDAFAEAYFGNDANYALWYGARGTGKSLMLALLALTKAVTLDINVVLLGGSMAQSRNVHEHVESLLGFSVAPSYAVERQILTELKFNLGNWVRPIPASQTTVRGPHPHMLLLDEIDEMDSDIYDAAMGQAMAKPNARGYMVPEMTVASSTWQNPIGTFQEVRDEALLKNKAIREWCYKEVLHTSENPNGWMDPAFIERKRMSVPAEMFRVEYDMGEPSGGSRAFDILKVAEYFIPMEAIREKHNYNDDLWVFEEPDPLGSYVAGADWAKERDKTVVAVFRTDLEPHAMVYLRTLNRQSWPAMVKVFNDTISAYHARSAHDATGVGNVVNDLVDERVYKVLMVDQKRKDLLNEYISDFEQGFYRMPIKTSAYNAHRATTMEMIWAGAAGGSHLPDEVAACAIANRARRAMPPPVGAVAVPKSAQGPAGYADLEGRPADERRAGVVSVRDPDEDVSVMWLP